VEAGVRGDGKERTGGGPSNVEIGTIHEFGATTPTTVIPQRSWLRATVDANERAYRRLLQRLGGDVVELKLDLKHRITFEQLRQTLLEAPILAHPDYNSEERFILDTDWSHDPGAIGGVLSQVQGGLERVICYGARNLTGTEKNLSSNKGELLAGIHFMSLWKSYLHRSKFLWRTDHEALRWINTMEEPQGLVVRWMDMLNRNDFEITHRPGTEHGNADSLSRCLHAREPNSAEKAAAQSETTGTNPDWRAAIVRAKAALPPEKLLAYQEQDKRQRQEQSTEADSLAPAIATGEIAAIQYPPRLSLEEITEQQILDPELKIVRVWLEKSEKPEPMTVRCESETVRAYLAIYECLEIRGETIYRQGRPGEFFTEGRICLPRSLQAHAAQICHQAGGEHQGLVTTHDRLGKRFYFPSLPRQVERTLRECTACQQERPGPSRDRVKQPGDYPFRSFCLDVLGPYKPSKNYNKYLLVAEDECTHWVEAYAVNEVTSDHLVTLLETHLFSRFGMPEKISNKGDNQFSHSLYRAICQKMRIPSDPRGTNPNPQNLSTILDETITGMDLDWEESVPSALLAIRTARHQDTEVTPFCAMYGREARMPIDLMYPNAQARLNHTTIENRRLFAPIRARRARRASPM